MKRKNYNESRNISFEELKDVVFRIMKDSSYLEYYDVLNNSESYEQLILNVQDSTRVHQYLFKQLKYLADCAKDYLELEKYVVYMDLLIDPRYPPLIKYKNNLLAYIFKCREDYFTSDEYCVIRHLIPFKRENLDEIIMMGWEGLYSDNILYKIFTCEIYLIEGQYSKAKKYIEEIGFVSLLLDYYDEYNAKLEINNKTIFNSVLKPSFL